VKAYDATFRQRGAVFLSALPGSVRQWGAM
jgi:hypothetical protein